MRAEEYVGLRIRDRREELKMSQPEFGRRLGEVLGRVWTRQAVSAAELGKRQFTPTELVAIASVLETRAARLMTPPVAVREVEMPGGATVETRTVADTDINDKLLNDMYDQLSIAIRNMKIQADYGADALAAVRHVVDGGLITAIARAEIETLHSDKPERVAQPVVAAVVTSPLGVLAGKRNDGDPPWGFVAGEIEPGESAADAAVREVKEETGCVVKAGPVIGERVHPRTGRRMIYLAAEPTHGTDVFVGDEAELAEVRWLSAAEADELLPDMFGPVREYLARELKS